MSIDLFSPSFFLACTCYIKLAIYDILIIKFYFDHSEGHDSVQDAAIALELAFLKAQQGESGSFICPWLDDPVPKCSIFEPLLSCEVSLCIDGLFYVRFTQNQLDARVNCITCHISTYRIRPLHLCRCPCMAYPRCLVMVPLCGKTSLLDTGNELTYILHDFMFVCAHIKVSTLYMATYVSL